MPPYRYIARLDVGPTRSEAKALLREQSHRVRALESRLTAEVLDGADVICTTLIGCGSPELRGRQFGLTVVDEATQATEPRTLLPLLLAPSGVVLLGDQEQLAPTCVSRRAAAEGLQQSLFDRIVRSEAGAAKLARLFEQKSPGTPDRPIPSWAC